MNDLKKEAVEEALANVELEDLKVSNRVILDVLDESKDKILIRVKGEKHDRKS